MATIRSDTFPLDKLQPHPRNYNRHSATMIGHLAEAMRQVAFTAPIVCRPDGVILGGHARRLALLLLRSQDVSPPPGIGADWSVPVRVVECSEAEELKILATDNPRRDWTDFDEQALLELLLELGEQDDLAGTWYSAADVDTLLQELGAAGSEAKRSEEKSKQRLLGEKSLQIKPVLYLDEVATFEAAIRAAGKKRRGEAVIEICRYYLEHHAEGQLHLRSEGPPAPARTP
jgi:hypothetical protein